MAKRARVGRRMTVLLLILAGVVFACGLSGCIVPSGHKIPAWEIHVTEDNIEEHLWSYAWHDAADDTHVLLFREDGTYEEQGGNPKLLPDPASGTTWEALYCDADGYANWQNLSQEQAEGVFTYRLVFRTGPKTLDQVARMVVEWDGWDLLLDGARFTPADLPAA